MEGEVINLVMKRFKPAFLGLWVGVTGSNLKKKKKKIRSSRFYSILVWESGAADLRSQVVTAPSQKGAGLIHTHRTTKREAKHALNLFRRFPVSRPSKCRSFSQH